MNFLDELEPRDGDRTQHPRPRAPPLKHLKRAETLDDSRLYRKRIAPSTANGSFGGLSRKIVQRQNSTPVNFKIQVAAAAAGPEVGPSSAGSGRRTSTSTVLAAKKLLAAKKRKQELLDRKNSTEKKSCLGRLKVFTIVCISTALILAGSSLLFVSLLILDPILVGLHAHFRSQPGICRTSKLKNTTGPTNCVMPSCREGCTADLYVCTFVYVTYVEPADLNLTYVESYYKHEIQDGNPFGEYFTSKEAPLLVATNNSYPDTNTTATLMVNPNGCGYAPEVNCSNFHNRFSTLGTVFPCFYSDSYLNDALGVAVPFYDRGEELITLGFYTGISMGALIVLSVLLLLLNKIKVPVKVVIRDTLQDIESNISEPSRRLFASEYSARLIDKVSSSSKEERVNGHGPKKMSRLASSPSLVSLLDKTDVATFVPEQPSTSRNLPARP